MLQNTYGLPPLHLNGTLPYRDTFLQILDGTLQDEVCQQATQNLGKSASFLYRWLYCECFFERCQG